MHSNSFSDIHEVFCVGESPIDFNIRIIFWLYKSHVSIEIYFLIIPSQQKIFHKTNAKFPNEVKIEFWELSLPILTALTNKKIDYVIKKIKGLV